LKVLEKIHHRINGIEEMMKIDSLHGIEVDVRYHKDELICEHDPFGHHLIAGQSLDQLLSKFSNKGILILNLKTEGIERACIDLMLKNGIKRWFFLDMSPAYLVKYACHARAGTIPAFSPDNLAVRFSDKEPLEQALAFKGSAGWLWIDSFERFPVTNENYPLIKKHFKTCLVSPELHGLSLEKIDELKSLVAEKEFDAVCTKRPDLWD
jgi:hypothetical protein